MTDSRLTSTTAAAEESKSLTVKLEPYSGTVCTLIDGQSPSSPFSPSLSLGSMFGNGVLDITIDEVRSLVITDEVKEHAFTKKLNKVKLPILNTKEMPFSLWIDTVVAS